MSYEELVAWLEGYSYSDRTLRELAERVGDPPATKDSNADRGRDA